METIDKLQERARRVASDWRDENLTAGAVLIECGEAAARAGETLEEAAARMLRERLAKGGDRLMDEPAPEVKRSSANPAAISRVAEAVCVEGLDRDPEAGADPEVKKQVRELVAILGTPAKIDVVTCVGKAKTNARDPQSAALHLFVHRESARWLAFYILQGRL